MERESEGEGFERKELILKSGAREPASQPPDRARLVGIPTPAELIVTEKCLQLPCFPPHYLLRGPGVPILVHSCSSDATGHAVLKSAVEQFSDHIDVLGGLDRTCHLAVIYVFLVDSADRRLIVI